ncbi:MAG TPA: Gfo/Idh/MocA family oxidoreductase [Chthoniobacteraceae bacterium]|nr:Gfo/Idh/MocA family oxidoreductase [Chthoniobacteraceae bacterium]
MNIRTTPPDSPLTRRTFLGNTAAAVAGGALIAGAPSIGRAQSAKTLNIALVGCGGRGSGAAKQALSADSNIVLTAMADIAPDQIEKSLGNLKEQFSSEPEKIKVDDKRKFVGLDAIDKVLASDVDVVLLTTPPGFRPEHFEKTVKAGKHAFCEKPIATDAPGVRRFLEAAKLSKEKGLGCQSGFCWRSHYPHRETYKRIHDGMIGDVRAIYGTYLTNTPWVKPRQPGWTDLEYQLRNWMYFCWLSGDHLVEQAVHTVDKMCWTMNDVDPISATGQGGRQQRVEDQYGHIYDHFTIQYEFPNNTRAFIFCRQQQGCSNEVSDHVLGTKGFLRQTSGRLNMIEAGTDRWKYQGPNHDMYQTEHDEFFASLREGKPLNFAEKLAHSTMVAIMGRMSAYTGQTITWEDAINSKEDLRPKEKLEWNMKLETPPVPIPGRTKFV